MPTRELLTPAQRLRLDKLPVDLDDRLMARYHTLSEVKSQSFCNFLQARS